jgi:hypothetical protein
MLPSLGVVGPGVSSVEEADDSTEGPAAAMVSEMSEDDGETRRRDLKRT